MESYFLGPNLRKIRKLHERKQLDIATSIGLSVRQYRKMENDEVPIKELYLNKLAQCYGVDTTYIKSFYPNNFLENTRQVSERDPQEKYEFYEKIIHAKDVVIQSQRELIELLKSKSISNSRS